MQKLCRHIMLLLGLTLAASTVGAESGLEARLRETVARMAGFESRVTGYSGCNAAADTVRARLLAMGVDEVLEHRFRVPVPMDEGFVLQAGGRQIRLSGVWPNLVRTSTVHPGGVRGRLLDAGDGSLEAASGRAIQDRIVLIDYASEDRWVDFFHLGARAIVFLESGRAHRKEAELKFLDVPADLPRFYAPGEDAMVLRDLAREDTEVLIEGRMLLRSVDGRTVIGFIEGRDPELKAELVLLSGYYDSISPVPAIAPGAEQACGAAGVMELVRDLCETRPRRSVAVVLTAGHCQNLSGMRSLVPLLLRAEERREDEGSLTPDAERLVDRFRAYEIRMLLDVDLSSRSHLLAAVKPAPPYRTRLIAPPISARLMDLAIAYEDSALGGRRALVNGLRQDLSRRSLGGITQTIPYEGCAAALAGLPVVTFSTANDARPGIDSPLDLPGEVDYERLGAQVAMLRYLVTGLVNDPDLPPWEWGKDAFGTIRGEVVQFGARSYLADQPVPGALVRVRLRNRTLAGVRGDFWVAADDSGRFVVQGVETNIIYTLPVRLEAYGVDDRTGAITDAPDWGINGERRLPGRSLTVLMDDQEEEVQVVTAPLAGVTLFETFDPRNLVTLEQVSVIDAAHEAEPPSFGACLPLTTPELDKFGYANRVGSWIQPTSVVFAKPGTRLKATMTSGRYGIGRRLVLLNSDPDTPAGSGYPVSGSGHVQGTVHRVAADLVGLNGDRIRKLARHGVRNARLTAFHERAGGLLLEAREARSQEHHAEYLSTSRRAWAYAAAAYRDVSGTQSGVIQGALFLLAALIPFAHFAERLAFGFPDLRRQVIGYFGFFLVGFTALRYLHPAFELSISPAVILLGFVIFTLGALVMGMGISRLNRELRELAGGRGARVRRAAGRSGAAARSVAVGLAHMRRRPLRTGLTCATLILLTFSVLSFTSIRSSLRTNRIAADGVARYDGVLVRMPAWQKMEVQAYRNFQSRFGADRVAPRAWLSTSSLASAFRVERDDERDVSAEALGFVGLTAQEAEVVRPQEGLVAGRWLRPGENDGCLVPTAVADSLRIVDADLGRAAIRVFGERFTVVGILSADALDVADLNGEPITPLDPEAQQPPEPEVGKSQAGRLPVFTHLPAAQVVVLPYRAVIRWERAHLASVAIRSRQDGDADVAELAETLDLNLFAGEGGRRYLVNTVGVATVSGLGDLAIPVAIGALIVLNTMLGAVYERTREIGTFNAVGLAPTHVSGLFLAEACAYAVVGGVLGYLMGLAAAQTFARFDLLAGLELNYSSMSAILALGLVMVVVVASAIYPASLASKICTPGIERRWRPPDPEGDRLRMVLPFTLAEADAVGMTAFLAEFWESYSEQSIGAGFYVEDLAVFRDGGTIGLTARTWLAPFDQGITQGVRLQMVPEEETGYFAIDVLLTRTEGDYDTWRRVCRTFLDDLRRQFLVWRTLSAEDREAYMEMGNAECGMRKENQKRGELGD